jgi:hypothetical protein
MKRRGELIKVGSLFDKYKHILEPPQSIVIKEVVSVVNNVCGVVLTDKYITYSVHNKTIAITAPSIVKQEILRKKDTILIHLKGRLGKKAPQYII